MIAKLHLRSFGPRIFSAAALVCIGLFTSLSFADPNVPTSDDTVERLCVGDHVACTSDRECCSGHCNARGDHKCGDPR